MTLRNGFTRNGIAVSRDRYEKRGLFFSRECSGEADFDVYCKFVEYLSGCSSARSDSIQLAGMTEALGKN
jgi:hypothetical protein